MAVIIAVDGGASRCRLAAFDTSGKLLARVEIDGHASLSAGVDTAWQHIRQGVTALRTTLGEAPAWQPDQLVMGLAGSLNISRRQELLNKTPRVIKAQVVTDGHAQLMGASGGAPGACLALGTGSVLHWLDAAGEQGMAGGWGFPVGDEGSGAWLGRRLVQAYVWHRDGQTSQSSLMSALEQRIGTDVSDIQGWTTESKSSVFAQLAPMIFEHASHGDSVAQDMMAQAVEQCLALVALAPPDLPVYVVGGVGEQLRPLLLGALPQRVCKAQGDALYGLWRISQQGNT